MLMDYFMQTFFLSFKIYMEFIAVFQNFKAFIFCLLHIFSQNRYGILLNPSWETGLQRNANIWIAFGVYFYRILASCASTRSCCNLYYNLSMNIHEVTGQSCKQLEVVVLPWRVLFGHIITPLCRQQEARRRCNVSKYYPAFLLLYIIQANDCLRLRIIFRKSEGEGNIYSCKTF